jgi:dihydrolipoamide dehydrogenase
VPDSSENTQPVGSDNHFDLVVIGGGNGGYGAALYGASAGLRVAIIEKDRFGGTCLHRGCIPAKELLESAAVHRTVLHASEFGIIADRPVVDWSITVDRKQAIVERMAGGLLSLLKGRKIQVFNGWGTLGPDRQVRAYGSDGESTILTADAVVLASGSVPRTIPGFEPGGPIMTSDEFLDMRSIPATAAVIGGGAIGCEFASTLADMGSAVTILEGLPKILPGCDQEVAKVVERSFTKSKNMTIRTGVKVTGWEPDGDGAIVHLDGAESLRVDVVVVSVGRRPFTDHLLADGTGVVIDDRGFIEVDEHCRTAAPSVWAVGDAIATPQLAHVAYAEGIHVVQDILGENPTPIDYGKVPWAIYCDPEVAFAGLTELAAKDAGFDVVTAKHRFAANGRANILGSTDGLVKVIAEKQPNGKAGRILGVHMVGPWVTEQLGQGYLAVNWEATVDEVAAFIQPHPTLSETFGETVMSLTGRSLH